MKKVLLFALVAFALSAQSKWKIDRSHSSVGFSIDHMVVSEVEGRFNSFSGTIETHSDDFVDANIEFEIDTKSIDTSHEGRDKHLRNEDFFNVEKFPKITFKSKSFKQVKGKKYKLVGDFTMNGVTKTIELDAKYNGKIKGRRGLIAGFKVTGVIDRTEYGLKYGGVLDAGGLAIGHDVTLNIKLEANEIK